MITQSEQVVARDSRYKAEYNIFPVLALQRAVEEKFSITYENCSNKLLEKIEKTITHIEKKMITAKNNEWAYYNLLIEDLQLWYKICSTQNYQIDIDEKIMDINDLAVKDIQEFVGIDYKNPYPIYLNDKLPGDYRNYHWDALNVRPRFHPNIPVGIYFAKETLSPNTKVLVYHEHIHVATSPNIDKFHFVLWFDEGIADVFSHLFSSRYFEDWQDLLIMNIRKYKTPTKEYRIRGWNAKNVAQIGMTYGTSFLKFLARERRGRPTKIDWLKLYNYCRESRRADDIKKCFNFNITDDIFWESSEKEKMVYNLFLSYEYPLALSSLAYYLLKKYVKMKSNDEFYKVSYPALSKEVKNIDATELKDACRELNGLLSVSTQEEGLRAWDTVGYYRDTPKFDFIKSSSLG